MKIKVGAWKLGDVVQTNLSFVKGFSDAAAPPGLNWKKNLTIVGYTEIEKEAEARTRDLYTVKSRSGKKFQINGCFLEAVRP